MQKLHTQKVVVYVVRNDKLLVFRHLDYSYEEVGIQVPAGSIKVGETPEVAALRELREETGYDCFQLHSTQSLGTATYDIAPYRDEIQERTFFLATPTTELPERWLSQEDHDGEQTPTRFECFWIPFKNAHVLQSGQGALLWRIPDILAKI